MFMPVVSADALRLGIDETTAGFYGYVHYRPGEPLSGVLVDFWRCVLEPEGKELKFSVRPILRSRLELEQDVLDIHISTLFGDEGGVVGASYTDAFLSINMALISLADNASLLPDNVWQKQSLGVVLRSNFYNEIQRQGGQVSVRVSTLDHLFKLLMSGRVSLMTIPLASPVEEVARYKGVALAGRTLGTRSVHGLVSPHRLAEDPELMSRINQRMPTCRPMLTPIIQSVFK